MTSNSCSATTLTSTCSRQRFPHGSAGPDYSLVMRGIEHKWSTRPDSPPFLRSHCPDDAAFATSTVSAAQLFVGSERA